MATQTLYPVYITSHGEYEGNILSSNGGGSARWQIGSGDKTRDIGIIAFDTKLRGLSKACSMNAFRVYFNQKHDNFLAAECLWVLTPKLITNAYVSGDIINVYSSSDYGSQGSISNNDINWTDESVAFFANWNDYQYIGHEDRYIGFHLKMQRDKSSLTIREYMSSLRATIDYTQRYYANFYAEDGTLIVTQTLNGGVAAIAPELAEKDGYEFLGWKCGETIYLEKLPSSVETDLNFTAVYRKKPVVAIASSGYGTVEPNGIIQCEYGSSLTINMTPDDREYYVKDIILDGESIGYNIYNYELVEITQDHNINVEFAKGFYCQVSGDAHGKLAYQLRSRTTGNWGKAEEVGNAVSGRYCSEKDYSGFRACATPDEGYEIKELVRTYYNPSFQKDLSMPYDNNAAISVSDGWEQKISVKFGKIGYPITLETDGNGNIYGFNIISYKESWTYEIEPNDHYIIKDVFLDGVSVLNDIFIENGVAKYTLADVTNEHTLKATFQRVVYLNFEADPNGAVIGERIIKYGEYAAVTISADEGYSIGSVQINGEEEFKATLAETSLYIPFEKLTEDKNIKVTFTNEIYHFNVIQPEEGGYINSSKLGDYVAGSEISLEATAYTGWHFSSWSFGGDKSKTTYTITSNAEISANFEKYAYTINATAGPNGRIVPESISANYGDIVAFAALPDNGYVLSNWDDGSTEEERNVTVTENASISASFVKGHYKIEVSAEEGGIVEGSGVYEFQTEVTIKAQPNAGYYFVEWNDGSVISERTITVPAGGGKYIAKFEKFKYNIDIECSPGGKATESQIVKYGEALNIEIASDIGYKISNITVDGESVYDMLTITKDGGRYLLNEVKAGHKVSIYFKTKRYMFARKMLDYYPPVLQNILDFQELMKAQEPLVGQAWDAVSFAWDNQFIDDATEEGVASWEKDYSLIPAKNDTLKQRKQHLKSKWVSNDKYTFEWLSSWLKTACGDSKFTEPKLEDYTVRTYLPLSSNYTNILADMRKYIPSNMAISPTLQLNDLEQKLYTGIAFRVRIKEEIKSETIEVTENAN